MDVWNILVFTTMLFITFSILGYVQLLASFEVNYTGWKVGFELEFDVEMKC
jgi:hypothetical protein